MKKLVLVLLFLGGCFKDPDAWQPERDAAKNLRVGMKMPAILKKDLVEADGVIEKWRFEYDSFATCKRDTVVSIWRVQ